MEVMKKMNESSPTTTTIRSYSSLYFNPLRHFEDEFQNQEDKENANANGSCGRVQVQVQAQAQAKGGRPERILKPRWVETQSLNIWDYSDSEAAPASSWSTLPNKSLICRPLPLDIGRCTCFILKEPTPHGLSGGTFFSLYTYEGEGRQNRKLAVAHHKRRNGRSHFSVARNVIGLVSHSDFKDTFLGTVTSNLMGSKYHIWDQGYRHNSLTKQQPLALVTYIPTVTTCAGSHRSMRAYIPKHQSMSLKNTTQLQHIKGLPMNWEGKLDKVHQLFSKVPIYNKTSKQYELDFRDKGKAGLRIQRSVKNFQLTLEADDPAAREGGKIKIRYGLQIDYAGFVFGVSKYKYKSLYSEDKDTKCSLLYFQVFSQLP
ncbi:Tubby-like protein 8, partial [Mucuna pruriens]